MPSDAFGCQVGTAYIHAIMDNEVVLAVQRHAVHIYAQDTCNLEISIYYGPYSFLNPISAPAADVTRPDIVIPLLQCLRCLHNPLNKQQQRSNTANV
jgi:hypothetical protein